MRTKWSGEVVATIDMFMALFVIMLSLAILAQPPKPTTDDTTMGQMKIELRWDCKNGDNDVDLWALPPGAQAAVGYSHKVDKGLALLRDDLGPGGDVDSLCYEIATANIIRPGLYVANAHLFRNRDGKLPVHVRLKVSILPPNWMNWVIVSEVEADLTQGGEELTLIRFRLDEKESLIPGSINNIPTPLRAAS